MARFRRGQWGTGAWRFLLIEALNEIFAKASWALFRNYDAYYEAAFFAGTLKWAAKSLSANAEKPARKGSRRGTRESSESSISSVQARIFKGSFSVELERPDISAIVIHARKSTKLLFGSMAALSRSIRPRLSVEIIIADLTSSQDEKAIINSKGAKLRRFHPKSDYAYCFNACAREAQGELVLFLVEGAYVEKTAIGLLHRLFCNDPRLAAASPLILSPTGSVIDGGSHFGTQFWPSHDGRRDYPEHVSACGVRKVDFNLFPGLMVRRSFFLDIDGFDNSAQHLYLKSMDLGLRFRQYGKGCLLQPNARIVFAGDAKLMPNLLMRSSRSGLRSFYRKRILGNRIFRIGWSECRIGNIDDFQSMPDAPGSIAVHLHLFYPELAADFTKYLQNIPYPFSLYISILNEEHRALCLRYFSKLKNATGIVIECSPNKGRDIGPFLCTFAKALAQHDYFIHLHTKKSPTLAEASGWRQYLLESLVGTEMRIRRIFGAFHKNGNLGLIYPEAYDALGNNWNDWMGTRNIAIALAARLGIKSIPECCMEFPAGSMFWARTEALLPLLDAEWTSEMFENENGAVGGTLAHAIERLFSMIAESRGYRPGILAGPGKLKIGEL